MSASLVNGVKRAAVVDMLADRDRATADLAVLYAQRIDATAGGAFEDWALDLGKLPACADYVATVVRKQESDLPRNISLTSMREEFDLFGLYSGTRMSAERLLWPQQTKEGASPPPQRRLYELTYWLVTAVMSGA